MVAGTKYFFELIHKGASANPHVAVGATSSNTFAELPLLASRFAPWTPKAPSFNSSFAISNVTSSSAKLVANATDDYEEAALKYKWSATGPAGSTVSFTPNDSNAAKNCTASFSKTGTYVVTLTVTDADGLSSTNTREILVK